MKIIVLRVVHPLKINQHVRIAWSHDDWFKVCFHLRSLNAHHFGMVEATRLESVPLRSFSVE
jgi:hypothetical protein